MTVFHNVDAPSSYSAAVVYLYYIVFTLAATVCNVISNLTQYNNNIHVY